MSQNWVVMAEVQKFSKVNIEISNICNLQCSFCPRLARPQGVMEIGLFQKVIEQVAPLTEQVCFHLMGEPLLHPRLSELVQICDVHGVKIFLVTNGVLLNQENVDLLLHRAFRQVNFSLHSFEDNFGDQDCTDYLEQIFLFTERAFVERPDLYLNYRLWNLDGPHGFGNKNNLFLERITERFGVSIDRTSDVRIQKSQRLKNRLYLHYDTEFIWPSLGAETISEKGTCHGLSSHFGVLVDGTVVPCCLDKEGDMALGNVRDQKIVEILASPKAQKMKEGFCQRRLVEKLCQRCSYIDRFSR